MSEANNEAAVIIIKKVKKGGHGGHHGGAWKVAYADFVTAMMAFFLLLWLLNATTEEQRRGIADYFSPAAVSSNSSGSDGVLGGLSLTREGAMRSMSSPVGITVSLPADEESEDRGEIGAAAEGADPEAARDETGRTARLDETAETGTPNVAEEQKDVSEQRLQELLAKREQAEFEAAAEQLRQAIQSVPELQEMAKHLIIDQTPEGMRIQIVDQEGRSMFPVGSADMQDNTRRLMELVAAAVKSLPNKIALKGHTDATPYRSADGYSNWELSTDRANASRRALIAAGLDPTRFESVVGRAAQDPLFPEDPTSPRNRRISIILLRDNAGGPIREVPNFQSGTAPTP